MLGARIDRFAAKHPLFRKYAEERIDIFFNTGLHVNIDIFITAGITGGLLSHSGNDVLKWGALAAMLLVWLMSAALAGFMKQWMFIFFEAVYFVLPQIIMIPDNGEALRETQYFVSDIVRAVWAYPIAELIPGLDHSTMSYILLVIYILIFLAGTRLRTAAKHSELYCRTRLGQLE